MREPSPEKKEAHRKQNDILYATVKDVESRLKAETGESYVWNHPEYDVAWKAWRQHYNTCSECGSTETVLENYDMMWHDGDIVCAKCDCYVRGWDAG